MNASPRAVVAPSAKVVIHALPGGYSRGSSRHAMPPTNRYSRALTTWRISSRRGLPRRFAAGIRSLIQCHWRSVSGGDITTAYPAIGLTGRQTVSLEARLSLFRFLVIGIDAQSASKLGIGFLGHAERSVYDPQMIAEFGNVRRGIHRFAQSAPRGLQVAGAVQRPAVGVQDSRVSGARRTASRVRSSASAKCSGVVPLSASV